MAEKTGLKVPKKLQSFEEVQRALQDIEASLNKLSSSVNAKAEGEITDKDGKTGDIRITQNTDKTYGLELKTDEGWKFPSVGESPVQLTGKKGEKARPDAIVDKFKDELGSPKNMPAPDYDSGWWYYLDTNSYNADMGNKILEHNFGTIPSFLQCWFAPFSTYNDGDPLYSFEVSTGSGMVLRDGQWSGPNVCYGKNKLYWHHWNGDSNAVAHRQHDYAGHLPAIITANGVDGQSTSGNWYSWEKGYFKILLWK